MGTIGIDRQLIRTRIEECRQGLWMVKQYNDFIQLCPPLLHINFFLPQEGGKVWSPPHTHDIGFTSTVLFGEMRNMRLTVEDHPDGDQERFIVKTADHSRKLWFEPTGRRAVVTKVTKECWLPGDTYSMDPREFHATLNPVPTITYLRQWPEAPVESYLLREVGAADLGTPERYVDDADLPKIWETVDRYCALAGL